MPLRYPRAAAYVAVGGAPLDVPFYNARCTHGFDQNIGTASFEVPYVTSRLRIGTWITLFIGATPAIPTSFVGRVSGYDWRNWPKSVVIELKGPLGLAEEYFPLTPVDLAGETDISAIKLILTTAGIPSSQQLILGSGATLGLTVNPGSNDQRFIWQTSQSALDMIQALDGASVGFRTFDSGGSGLVIRRLISSIPMADPSYTFTGGVDIGEGASTHLETHKGTAGTVVFGYTGATGIQIIGTAAAPARAGGSGYDVIDNPLIETQTQADDVAIWGAAELGRPLLTVSLPTPRDDAVVPGQTIYVDDIDRLNVRKNMWAQNRTRQLETSGAFTQTITLISEAMVDMTTSSPGVQHLPGTGTQESPAATSDANKPTADFAFEAVDHEITDGAVEFWIIQVRDAGWSPAGSIVTRAWSTDTTTVPDTGSEQLFIFKTTDLATVITLSVTDSNGETASVSKPCNGPEAEGVTLNRHLYLAGTSAVIAYDGAGNWNVQALASLVVANGPAWAEGGNVAVSIDDLATAPSSVVAFASQQTSAVYCETDINASAVYAGGDGGSVSLSTDGGSTWTEKAGPSAQPVRRIIASRFTPGELWVLDDVGDVYQSPDYGASWMLIASHPGAVDMCLSNFRNWVGGSFGVATLETSQLATWPGATPNIVAMDTHIREDRVYAIADDGTTYYINPEAGLAMVAGANLPAGTAQLRGLRRDGAAVDLIYLASGTNGLYKSHDGLRTTPAYTLIYSGGEDIVCVGYGDFPLAFSGGGGGPALFFIQGWYALLADDSWEFRSSPSVSGVAALNGWADDANTTHVVYVVSDTPPVYHVFDSTDGANTWVETSTGAFPTGTETINTLLLPYRNGQFRVMVFEPTNGSEGGVKGGEYASADGSSWTRTGRGAPKLWPGGTILSNTDGWCASSAHVYFLMDITPAGGTLALHVDAESGTPETQRLARSGTVSGGTYTIQVGSFATGALNVSDSAATVLAALQGLSSFGPGGSASGTIAGDNLDITFPFIGPQPLLDINNGSVTGGGTIVATHLTPGTAGIRADDASFGFSGPMGMFAAIEADVAMIIGASPSFDIIIEKYIDTAAPVVVTPGFLINGDAVQNMASRDGDTWVAMIYDSAIPINRLIVSHDQGATWTKVGPTTPGISSFFGSYDIAPDPVTAGTWWVIFNDPSVWKSVDDGDTWAMVGDPPPVATPLAPLGGKSH